MPPIIMTSRHAEHLEQGAGTVARGRRQHARNTVGGGGGGACPYLPAFFAVNDDALTTICWPVPGRISCLLPCHRRTRSAGRHAALTAGGATRLLGDDAENTPQACSPAAPHYAVPYLTPRTFWAGMARAGVMRAISARDALGARRALRVVRLAQCRTARPYLLV